MSRLTAIPWVLLVSSTLTVAHAQTHDSMDTDIRDAGRLSLSQDALRQHHNGAGKGNGISVSISLEFPGNQTGLSNIEVVMLQPEGAGAHSCEAIAVKEGRNRLRATYNPVKDVRPNRSYLVLVSDARGDKYAVGRIRIAAARSQSFRIDAPLLTPSTPVYGGPQSGSGYAPAPSTPYHPPRTGPGYVPPGTTPYTPPKVGPGYVRPGG